MKSQMVHHQNTKSELLGMPFGTARYRLHKTLLFELTKRLNLDVCYRCKQKIVEESLFSVDHKNPWMQAAKPQKAFFNLDNIAFSHISCNTSAANNERRIYDNATERKRAETQRWYATNKVKIRKQRKYMRSQGLWP